MDKEMNATDCYVLPYDKYCSGIWTVLESIDSTGKRVEECFLLLYKVVMIDTKRLDELNASLIWYCLACEVRS